MDLSGSRSGSDVDYLRQIISEQLAMTHTSIPAIIESFDPATQMCECIPVIRARKKSVDGEESTEDRPKLVKVPMITPYVRTLGFSLTMPVQPGDWCLLMFSERGLDYWQESAEISDPPEDVGARIHDMTDGIAAYGPIPNPDAILDYQIDSMEMRNRVRNSSFQLWEDELEARIKNGTFTHQKANGDIDTEATNDMNTKVGGSQNTNVIGSVNKRITISEKVQVTVSSSKTVGVNDYKGVIGVVDRVSGLDSNEYSYAKLIKNADGDLELHSDTLVVIKAPVIRICDDTIIQGNLIVEGDVTINGMSFTNHKHPGVTVGASSTSTPVAGPGPGPPHAACPSKPIPPIPPIPPIIPDPERRGP